MREQLKVSHPLAKKIYMNAFVLSLDTGKKQLPKDLAVDLWSLLLPLYDPASSSAPENGIQPGSLSALWVSYVESPENNKPLISRDVWNTVFDLVTQCKPDLSDFDVEEGAWPLMIDAFVEWFRKRQG